MLKTDGFHTHVAAFGGELAQITFLRSWMSCALSVGDKELYSIGDPIDLKEGPGEAAGVLQSGELNCELDGRYVEANET